MDGLLELNGLLKDGILGSLLGENGVVNQLFDGLLGGILGGDGNDGGLLSELLGGGNKKGGKGLPITVVLKIEKYFVNIF